MMTVVGGKALGGVLLAFVVETLPKTQKSLAKW